MLQTVSRCRPVTLQAWVCLMGLGIVTWALPTVSVSSVLAQSPSQQTEKQKQTESQPIPQLKTVNDLSEAVTRKDSQVLPSEIYGLPKNSSQSLSLNFVEIMNSYFEAVKKLRGSGVSLEGMQLDHKRGAITLSELQSWHAEIETARRKTELLPKIVTVVRESAEEELKLLSEEKKLVEQSFKTGKTGIDTLLGVRRRELQVRSNLKILELLLESMKPFEIKINQPQPEKLRKPQTDASTTKSHSEIEKTIQTRLGLRLSKAGIPPAWSQSKYRGGLRVREVVKDGPAEKSGIREGDILVGLHRWETTSFEDVDFVLSKPDKFHDGRLKFYMVRDKNTWFGHMQIEQ
ncbi:MAG: PDZ domain-containing protein [Planctomycetes bacterium]|nr:PDZ domain-containing protein [Planctomycetota bacterium]